MMRFLVVVFGTIFIGFVIYAAIARSIWLNEHCTVIGKMSGDTGVGFGVESGEMTVIATSGKTGYQCDDGIIYWE